MITFQQVSKSFGHAPRCNQVLAGVSFEVTAGSFITLFGPNGCGKSTLMNILSGIEVADSGTISGIQPIRQQIGFVFQDYRQSLLPWRSVAQNILFPLDLRSVRRNDANTLLDRLIELAQVNIDLKQRVFTLSGGQAQIVSLLRALIINPRLLILDEPFSALDYSFTLSFRQKITEIAAALELTTIFISHDLEEALYLGDKVVFLTSRPTTVQQILEVPFARPRSPELLGTPEFAALKLQALRIFERCVPGNASVR